MHVALNGSGDDHVAGFHVADHVAADPDNQRPGAMHRPFDTAIHAHGAVGIQFAPDGEAIIDYRIALRLTWCARTEKTHERLSDRQYDLLREHEDGARRRGSPEE